eukprot:5992484-Amphidinium_carterae.1
MGCPKDWPSEASSAQFLFFGFLFKIPSTDQPFFVNLWKDCIHPPRNLADHPCTTEHTWFSIVSGLRMGGRGPPRIGPPRPQTHDFCSSD